MATSLDVERERAALFIEYLVAARGSLASGFDQATHDREAFARGDLTIEQFEKRVESRLRNEMAREKRRNGAV